MPLRMYHITWNISPHIFLIKKCTWVMCNSKCTTWKLAQHQISLDYEITNKIVLMIDLVRYVWRPKVLWCLTTKSEKKVEIFNFRRKRRIYLGSTWTIVKPSGFMLKKNLLKRTFCLMYCTSQFYNQNLQNNTYLCLSNCISLALQ